MEGVGEEKEGQVVGLVDGWWTVRGSVGVMIYMVCDKIKVAGFLERRLSTRQLTLKLHEKCLKKYRMNCNCVVYCVHVLMLRLNMFFRV